MEEVGWKQGIPAPDDSGEMTRLFDKCFLHIGTEKTGTTTLQTFLGMNRDGVMRRGFFVPSSLSPHPILANHERLTTTSLNLSKLSDDLRVAAGLSQLDHVLAHRRQVADDFRTEVECLQPDIRTLVLSNEHCHSRLTADDEIQTLAGFLAQFSNDVQVIVYLRPQHELAVSLYNQALKAGYCDIDVLPDFTSTKARWVEQDYFDYEALVMRWGRVFGPDNITVRLFDRAALLGHSVLDDFCHCIACDTAGLVRPDDVNVAISAELQSVLNVVNRFCRDTSRPLSNELRYKVIALLEGLSRGAGRQPSRADAQRFYAMFLPGNERVRQLYFPHRPVLFDIDFQHYPDQEQVAGSERDHTVTLLLSLIEAVPRGFAWMPQD